MKFFTVKTLHRLFLTFGTFQFLLLVWAEIQCTMHVALLKRLINQFKPVQQSRKQALKAYCPNIYTVHHWLEYCISLHIGFFLFLAGCSSVTSEYFFNQQRWLHGARTERLVTKFVDTKTPTKKVFFQLKDWPSGKQGKTIIIVYIQSSKKLSKKRCQTNRQKIVKKNRQKNRQKSQLIISSMNLMPVDQSQNWIQNPAFWLVFLQDRYSARIIVGLRSFFGVNENFKKSFRN